MRGSNGASDPIRASTDRAPAAIPAAKTASVANRPARARAVEHWVPFSRARPSFGPRTTGFSPALARAVTASSV
ncbi:hypothetical protein D3C85_1445760 [compost metagenome]